jgi:CubicO group peptidase (beta-lactamase class C family)
MRNRSTHPTCLVLALVAAGCSGGAAAGDAGNSPDASGPPGVLRDYLGNPAFPDDFWRPASFAESNVDPAPLEQAVARIATAGWDIHSFLIARNGRLVFERYAGTWRPSERHAMYSTTKSVLSALIGVAIHEGSIPGLDRHAVEWFPDADSLNPSPEKSAITLDDLLTMRSGLAWTEGDQTTFAAPDPARAMLSRDVVDAPVGTIWNYSSGNSDILSEILRVATRMTPLAYANAKVLGPIGIVDPPWVAGQNGTHHGGWGLSLTSREMARFGELFRNGGVWGGQQIVPAGWVSTSTAAHSDSAWGMPYGLHWWIFNVPGFFGTIGAFGQQIFISPGLGLVVVFTADLPSETANTTFQTLIADYVVPAIRP